MKRHIKFALAAITTAALLTACGGGSKNIQFTSVVSFGDSVSDAGAYKVGTVAALGGGKFTVNGGADNTWTQVMSLQLGVGAQCAAQTGLLPNIPAAPGTPPIVGAPVTNIAACTNYAQGSSRVTAVGSGPNGVALQAAPYNQVNLGLIADSIQNQINRHLAKVGGSFRSTDLVTVNGGGNDFFMQLGAVSAAAGGGAAAAGAGTIAGWPAATIATVSAGGAAAATAASTAAVTGMGQAGAELATYVRTLIAGRGAFYIVVRNLGDLNNTPFGSTFDANTKALSTAMTTAYNAQLAAGLNGVAGVILWDDYTFGRGITANPAALGFTNVTIPNCGRNGFSAPGETVGSSLVCNATNLIPGDTSKYAFADSVHPTPYAHQVSANEAIRLMRAAGIPF
jgi:outer membrane lipase/esterase